MAKLTPAERQAVRAIVQAARGRRNVKLRKILRDILDGEGTDNVRRHAVREIKARLLERDFKDHPNRNPRGELTLRTSRGDVSIASVTFGDTDDVTYVDVLTTGVTENDDPHFRIINPPSMVDDPGGDVVVTKTMPDGRVVTRRFREDPLTAIAEAVASQGGARR